MKWDRTVYWKKNYFLIVLCWQSLMQSKPLFRLTVAICFRSVNSYFFKKRKMIFKTLRFYLRGKLYLNLGFSDENSLFQKRWRPYRCKRLKSFLKIINILFTVIFAENVDRSDFLSFRVLVDTIVLWIIQRALQAKDIHSRNVSSLCARVDKQLYKCWTLNTKLLLSGTAWC